MKTLANWLGQKIVGGHVIYIYVAGSKIAILKIVTLEYLKGLFINKSCLELEWPWFEHLRFFKNQNFGKKGAKN